MEVSEGEEQEEVILEVYQEQECGGALEEKKEVEEIVMTASLGSLQANVWHQEKVEERCDGECEEI